MTSSLRHLVREELLSLLSPNKGYNALMPNLNGTDGSLTGITNLPSEKYVTAKQTRLGTLPI
jgi:hypothetical protein